MVQTPGEAAWEVTKQDIVAFFGDLRNRQYKAPMIAQAALVVKEYYARRSNS